MSDSVRPRGRQPTRLPRPWDSPGKSTGGGCHFLLQCMEVKSEREVAQLCPTLSMDYSLAGSSIHGMFQARVLEWGAIAFSAPVLAGRFFTTSRLTTAAAAAGKLLQSCPTLCDPRDGSPPGFPVPGILRQEHWSGLPFPSPMHESEK